MYVVMVEFDVSERDVAAFMPLMRENAGASRSREPGCRQFDVCVDPANPASVFLYELYDDRAAFKAHLASEHYRRFDAATKEMIVARRVRLLERLDPSH